MEKKKNVYFTFAGLEKVYGTVLGELVYWYLRKRNVPETDPANRVNLREFKNDGNNLYRRTKAFAGLVVRNCFVCGHRTLHVGFYRHGMRSPRLIVRVFT